MRSMTKRELEALRPGNLFYWHSPTTGWRGCFVSDLLPCAVTFHFAGDDPDHPCVLSHSDFLDQCGVPS